MAQRMMERIDRAVVAIPMQEGNVYLGWRLLGDDPDDIEFNIYRSNGDAVWQKLNKIPITRTTDFLDSSVDLKQANHYEIRPIIKGNELKDNSVYSLQPDPAIQQYLSIPLQKPADGEINGEKYTYSANDASVGDLTGDGNMKSSLNGNPPMLKIHPRQDLPEIKFWMPIRWREIYSGA